MKQDGLQRMLDFLATLRSKDIRFRIERQSPDALMVTFVSGNTCFEVDFFVDEVWFSTFAARINTGNDEAGILRTIAERWDD